jgi:hypothetical protein
MRSRNNYQDANSVRGRVSSESTVSLQQQQLSRGGPSPTSHRARQTRTGPTRARLSGEFKLETSSATAIPWFLGDDYEAEDVHYNDNGVLVAATLEAFVEMLTTHKNAPGNEKEKKRTSKGRRDTKAETERGVSPLNAFYPLVLCLSNSVALVLFCLF